METGTVFNGLIFQGEYTIESMHLTQDEAFIILSIDYEGVNIVAFTFPDLNFVYDIFSASSGCPENCASNYDIGGVSE